MARNSSQFTQILSVVLVVVAVLSAVSAIVLPLNQLTSPEATARVDINRGASLAVLNEIPGLGENVVLVPDADQLSVHLDVVGADGEPAPVGLRLLTDAGTSVWSAAVAIIAFLLAGLLNQIGRGEPFHERNPRRLLWIGVTIIVGSVLADSLNWLAASQVVAYANVGEPLQVVPYYSVVPWVVGAIVLALASAFRSGRSLSLETEGLV